MEDMHSGIQKLKYIQINKVTHGNVHVAIGGLQGQMSIMASPLDPLF